MDFHIVLEDKSSQTRVVKDEKGRIVLTADAGSYVLDAGFVTDGADVHVLIGRYTSLSYGVVFAFYVDTSSCTANYVFEAEIPREGGHQITIGSDVRIESNVIIRGGVHIGDGALLRAGGIVSQDVPPYAVVEGNPAKIRGYRFDAETITALQKIAWWNWSEAKIRQHIHLLRAAPAAFLAGVSNAQKTEIPALSEQIQQKLNDFFAEAEQFRMIIGENIRSRHYEEAMRFMTHLSVLLYNCNQTYMDEVLEGYLSTLSELLPEPASLQYKHERRRIVFYDLFGRGMRGLTQIYLRALSRMDIDLYYITTESARGNIPKIEAVMNECGGSMYFMPKAEPIGLWKSAHLLCGVMEEIQPDAAFLYTMPWDVIGIPVFMRYAGCMKRYQINLTDHAFWLGAHAFDYVLEFRDFGANVSRQYRHIAPHKILKQPYYPYIDRTLSFQGFPFEKKDGDFVIFSGGALYKTLNEEKTYYHIVDFCLRNFPQVKFWYAGIGSPSQFSELLALQQKYEGRVFITGERDDLFQIMRNVDMYLNTCPQPGGLMTQYSALAGRPPFNFLCLPYGSGAPSVLLPEEDLGIEYTDMAAFLAELRRFIEDSAYRWKKESLLRTKKLVITEDEFAKNLEKILREGQSNYSVRSFDVDLRLQEVQFAQIWYYAKWEEALS